MQTQASGDDDDDYRFGFNGQEKDNEAKGKGNSLDFGARMHDTRTGRLGMSLDPLAAKFPYQSPYVFAGNNPIWNIDKKGLKKETFNITINQQTGATTLKMITSPGLIAKSYTSMYSGIRTYDWYDYTEANVTVIDKQGRSSTQTFTFTDKFRTNTLFKSEEYAKAKIGEKDFFNFSPIKEEGLGKGGGLTLTTKGTLNPGNNHLLNRNGRGEFVNIDEIAAAFGASAAANGTSIDKGVRNLKNLLAYGKDAINAAGAMAEQGVISVDFQQCESCGKYSQDGKEIEDTSGKGITPENTSKESLQEFHK